MSGELSTFFIMEWGIVRVGNCLSGELSSGELSWIRTTRVKLVTTGRTDNPAEHVYSCEYSYWWSGTNYEPVSV